MKTVKVRNVVIGEGMPKICVPIVGATREAILEEANVITRLPADLVEWRIDWFEDVFEFEKLAEVLRDLREALGDRPILLTFRTSREGGAKAIGADAYADLYLRAMQTGCLDLIDVELYAGDETVRKVIGSAHAAGVGVVVSNHDFSGTPDKDEIVRRLCKMQTLGADLPKIAVMPASKKDVLTLLAATEEMASRYADRPIITMSMAGTGVISRLAGEVFGSALTFGAASRASAPGQMGVEDLRTVLTRIHDAL